MQASAPRCAAGQERCAAAMAPKMATCGAAVAPQQAAGWGPGKRMAGIKSKLSIVCTHEAVQQFLAARPGPVSKEAGMQSAAESLGAWPACLFQAGERWSSARPA